MHSRFQILFRGYLGLREKPDVLYFRGLVHFMTKFFEVFCGDKLGAPPTFLVFIYTIAVLFLCIFKLFNKSKALNFTCCALPYPDWNKHCPPRDLEKWIGLFSITEKLVTILFLLVFTSKFHMKYCIKLNRKKIYQALEVHNSSLL